MKNFTLSKQLRDLAKTAALATYKSVIKSAQNMNAVNFLKSIFNDPGNIVTDLGGGNYHVQITDAQWANWNESFPSLSVENFATTGIPSLLSNHIKELSISSPAHKNNVRVYKEGEGGMAPTASDKSSSLKKSAQNAVSDFFKNTFGVKATVGNEPGTVIVYIPAEKWDAVSSLIIQNQARIKGFGYTKVQGTSDNQNLITIFDANSSVTAQQKQFAIKAAKEAYKSTIKSLIKQAQGFKDAAQVIDEVLDAGGLSQYTPCTRYLGFDASGAKSVIGVNSGTIVLPFDPTKIDEQTARSFIPVFQKFKEKFVRELAMFGVHSFKMYYGTQEIPVF
jgi:hypothetical protein